jgi:CRP/FNR family transcriptional regulator, cyclic AMP receptor protein
MRSQMLDRFSGDTGRRFRLEALASQKIVMGNRALAEELADCVDFLSVPPGETLIEQGGEDDDIYFIIAGTLDVVVNGRLVARRGATDHVGEMAAVQPIQRRSASVIAAEGAIVAKLNENSFNEIASRYPEMYRFIAQELSRRLLHRNPFVTAYREQIRVFIISSAEALPIARAIQNAFANDPFLTTVWTDGVFRVANYTLESLEAQIADSDFAIAIAHANDLSESCGKAWPSPRDNIIFELGLFVGRLGRARAILVEPREEEVKLPSDLAGLTTISYRFEKGADLASLLTPACNRLRDHINGLGSNNG